MDVSTIKTPVEKTGEPHANSQQEPDAAFLELLAGLGLRQPIQPNQVDVGKVSTVNGGLSLGLGPILLGHDALAGSSAATTAQEKTASGKTEDANALLAQTIQASQQGTAAEELLAHVLAFVGQSESAVPETAPARPIAREQKGALVAGQALAIEGKATSLPDVNGVAQNIPEGTAPKDLQQATLAKLMELAVSTHGLTERGSAPGGGPASLGIGSHGETQPSISPDMSVKQTSASAQTVVWGAIMESSPLPESGKENDSASADHEGGKARFSQAEANGGQMAPAAVTASFSAQSPPAPTRSAAVDGIQAPTAPAPLESPLPASVRFEVQPGDLGRIRVHVSVIDHTVYTNVLTERVEAHDFLVKGSERYETGLAAHGLDVGRFQVDVQGQSRDHADRGGAAWSQEQTPRHRDEPLNHLAAEWQAEGRPVEWEDRMVNVFA